MTSFKAHTLIAACKLIIRYLSSDESIEDAALENVLYNLREQLK